MQEYRADGTADQGKLFVRIAAPIIDIKLQGDPISRHGLLEHFLEVISIVVIKQAAANQETGMVVNDHNAVDPPTFPVFCDIRQITGIRLPHFPKGILFKSLAVPHAWITCGFEVIMPDKALDSTNADRSRNERILHKLFVDLCGIEPGESLFQTVDLFYSGIREDPGSTFIRAFLWHQGIDPACLVKGYPFADGLGAVLENGSIRQGQWFFRDAAVISVPGSIRKKAVDHRCDQGEPELRDFCGVRELLFLIFH